MTDPRTPVRDVMSRGAISVDEKLTLRSLAAVLTELQIGVALIEGSDGRVGLASERDVAAALAAGADPDEVWAADIAIDDLVIAEPEDSVADVADQMVLQNVRHVPIVERGIIVGVVSERDILPVLADHARATL